VKIWHKPNATLHFPRLKSRGNSKMSYCYLTALSHDLMVTSPHHLIITSPHYPICTLAYLHIYLHYPIGTLPHWHICTLAHLHILRALPHWHICTFICTLPHYHINTLSHYHIAPLALPHPSPFPLISSPEAQKAGDDDVNNMQGLQRYEIAQGAFLIKEPGHRHQKH
jgi:hypothetical protein